MVEKLDSKTEIKTDDSETSLKILLHKYLLQYSPELASKFDEFGVFNGGTGTITIDETIPDAMQFEVLVHEVCEAINYHLELGLKHSTITALAAGFATFLADNKAFMTQQLTNL